MKNKIILFSLVGVIAVGIVLLYRSDNADVAVTETAEDVLVTETETTSLTDAVTGETDVVDSSVSSGVASSNDTSAAATQVADTTYADGTYTVTLPYSVPNGSDSITLTLSIADDAVTAVSTSYAGYDHESREYQDRFDAKIESAVVGKAVDSISLSRVGGASLTTKAFNEALADIKSEASA